MTSQSQQQEADEQGPSGAPLWQNFTQDCIDLEAGIRMTYRSGGSGDAVLLLHGWPQHSQMWHSIAPQLAARYRVIAPDLRGAGGTTIKGPYNKATMAADILDLLDRLRIDSVRLVGYDLGGGVAYDLAARHSDRISHLAIMEFGLPGFGYEHEMMPKPDWHPGSNWHLSFFTVPDVADWAFRGRERELLSWFFAHIAAAPAAVSTVDFELYVRLLQRPGALRAGIEYYASVWQDAQSNRSLATCKLPMPVLGMGGQASAGAWVAEGLKAVAEHVQGAVISNAGHWLGDENPNGVVDALLTFFASEETSK